MNDEIILGLLNNSGIKVISITDSVLKIEDPGCIIRSFEKLINYGWGLISLITAVLIFGWAIAYIRGSKISSILNNFKNIVLILSIVSVIKPIISIFYGDDIFTKGCREIEISKEKVNNLLELRKSKLSSSKEGFETLYIIDSFELTEKANFSSTSLSTSNLKRTLIFINDRGQKIKRVGGTISWRNNNPGNIRTSSFTKKNGEIGQAGGFAVFPSLDIGMNAIKKLLRSKSYNNLTIEKAISRYAPDGDGNNNEKVYQKRLGDLTGLNINLVLNSLSNEQLDKVANAIKIIEGYNIGKEYIFTD